MIVKKTIMNKQSFITILLTVLMCMTGAKVFAYDFAIANSDGATIYYSLANEEKTEGEESVALDPYVIWCEDNMTLYFLGNGDDISNGKYKGHIVENMWHGETVTKMPENPKSYSHTPVPWAKKYIFQSCTRVVIEESFKDVRVTSTSGWFAGCDMHTIEGIEYLNTSEVTSMSNMFGCPNLSSIDVSHFDTRKVKYMQGMFCSCKKIETIDLSSFDTSNVLDMTNMFGNCNELKTLNLSNFNTSKVTNMAWMFRECYALADIDLSSFNTANVTSMNNMFLSCSSLTSLDLTKFNTEKVTEMYGMFANCSGLTSLDLSNFNTANVTSMAGMFKDCTNLKTIYVSNKWTTDNVEDRGYEMFANCNKLIGEQGTAYLDINSDILFAHIDGGRSNPGYFTAKGGDLLTVKDIRMNKGQFKTITIDLENITKDFAAYQFYLTLPEGFTLLTDDKGKMKATLGSRYSNINQSLTVDASSDGRTYLFLSFPRPEGIIEGNRGPLLSVTIVSNTEQAEGTYSAIVHDVVFTRAGGSELSLADTRFNIEMTNIKSGDANGDGKVNVSDIVEAMNYIMGKPSEIFDESAADMNGDCKVNVADIVMMVKLIKNQNNEQEETKTDYSKQPFTIVPINSDISVTFWPYYNVVHQGYSILYSKDGGQTWDSTGSDWELSLEVNSDEKLMIIVTGGFFDALSISGGTFNVEGNIMSLIARKEFESATKIRTRGSTKLNGFFKGNKNLISAENLVLPATDLEENCYANMFEGCTSIKKAPILPATRLVKGCYSSMFAGCTSLKYVNCSAIDISAPDCTTDWLKDVSPTGTFVKTSSMDGWPTGASGIPSGWTVESVPLIPIPY